MEKLTIIKCENGFIVTVPDEKNVFGKPKHFVCKDFTELNKVVKKFADTKYKEPKLRRKRFGQPRLEDLEYSMHA